MTKVILISIAIAVAGFIPLMGIPGAFMFMLAKPIISLLYGPMSAESFEYTLGDGTWPLMIMLSVIWPISIPVAYFISQKLFGPAPFFSIGHLIPFLVFMIIGASVLSTITVAVNGSLKKLSDAEILEQAIRIGKLSLVKKHWKPNEKYKFTLGDPLYIALDNKQKAVANYLLENGANPHEYSQDAAPYDPGLTPLHTAAKSNMTGIMKKLFQIGVDPNIRFATGKTPLHTLDLDKSALPVIELLKKHKADFTATDDEGNTALIRMVMVNAPLDERPLLVQKMIEYGCPVNSRNNAGETALDIVKKQQPYDKELIRVLSNGL